MYISVDDIESLYLKFVAQDLDTDNPEKFPSLRIPSVKQSGATQEFAVTDPNGNKITFGQGAS
ncbi:MAG: hypothetical protein ACI87H_001305 [Gammaproteobacteria bacterium]|jgi:hypothetical protein